MINLVKVTLRKLLNILGLEIHRVSQANSRHCRYSMQGCLQQAFENGLNPKTIIDVGAAKGTPALYKVFPKARHVLIEPLEEFAPCLDTLVGNLDNAEYILAAATSHPGSIVINVHPDLVGSSIYKEEEESNVNGVERIIPAIQIDQLCLDKSTQGPYLIKIDTQGSELDVLRGALSILEETEFIILEVSLFEFFQDGPQIYDCMKFMNDHGFVAYDIFDLQYRLLDRAMSQVDIAFVKENSCLRKFHFYATEEQRNEQNKQLAKL